MLADYASKFTKLEDGQISYEIGGMKVDRAKLTEHLKAEYPFLVDGSQATGGGATGGGNGVSKSKTVTISEFKAMDHAARSAFSKTGGKVVDD